MLNMLCIYIYIIVINFARTIWVWLSMLDIIISYVFGYLWYPSFTVILFGISLTKRSFNVCSSTFLPMWNAYTSMFEGQPSALQNHVFLQMIVCLQVCMQAKSYVYDDIYFYPHIPHTHMNMIICIRMHNTESISPFNTRRCQPHWLSDLVLRFYRRNPKPQEWFRRTAGWDTICLSASFFFSVAILLQNVEAQLRIYKAIYGGYDFTYNWKGPTL